MQLESSVIISRYMASMILCSFSICTLEIRGCHFPDVLTPLSCFLLQLQPRRPRPPCSLHQTAPKEYKKSTGSDWSLMLRVPPCFYSQRVEATSYIHHKRQIKSLKYHPMPSWLFTTIEYLVNSYSSVTM